ncbi:hypothetical protein MD484_g2467, partial [Candolleomyces efflorescens]
MECESEEEGSDGSWETISTEGSCDLELKGEEDDDSDYEMVADSDSECTGTESDQLLSDDEMGTEIGTSASTVSSSTYFYVSCPAFGQDTGRRGNPNVVINTVFEDDVESERLPRNVERAADGEQPFSSTGI